MVADVVVVGSGGAGLTAAVTAASLGADVVLLEREPLFGGTTSFSGGGLWIPANRWMRELGLPDSKDDAFRYVRRLVNRSGLEPLITRYLDECNPMLNFLEEHTAIRFEGSLNHPDYQPAVPGARDAGRGVNQGLFPLDRLGPMRPRLRLGWATRPVTLAENDMGRALDLPIQDRIDAGLVGLGAGLVAFLLEGCMRHGVDLRHSVRARELVRSGDRVIAVVAESEGERLLVEARRGVILACGGFEWDRALVDRFLGVPMTGPASPGHNVGDGLRMAMAAGAGLGTMSEAWWNMVYAIPGDEYEGHQLHRPTSDVRGRPGMVIVNRQGRRFVDEAMNYHDLGKAMYAFDPGRYEFPNTPAYMVFDAEFRSTYRVGTQSPSGDDLGWLCRGATIRELGQRAGIDPAGLEAQVASFNRAAARGEDPEFGRGGNAYDLHMGDRSRPGVSATLRPLGAGPYFAVQTHLGCFGTKGGPMTDANGQVLDLHDRPIPGLYAAGNVAAHVFGAAYPGPGATLGPALTFGYVAARHILS